eukprot:6167122-Amphidinium_carterae.1
MVVGAHYASRSDSSATSGSTSVLCEKAVAAQTHDCSKGRADNGKATAWLPPVLKCMLWMDRIVIGTRTCLP